MSLVSKTSSTGEAPPASEPSELDTLEAQLGAAFADRRLLLMALTHRSYLNETGRAGAEDNERLEFLGDALIDFVTGDYLYRRLPEAREGELTTLRAALVCEPALAGFGRALDLGAYLRMGRGEIAGGGRGRQTLLCNAFEALVGAVYLDQGFATAEALVMRFLTPELESMLQRQRLKDAKSRFQEYAQRVWQTTPRYVTVGASGPDHAKSFVVEVTVGATTWGRGEGRSKALAAQLAAQEALERATAVVVPAADISGDQAKGMAEPDRVPVAAGEQDDGPVI